MTKRIWGTLSPFFPDITKKEVIIGMNIANSSFIRAMLRYSTFDELHFFVFSGIQASRISTFYEKDLEQFQGEVRFFWREELPRQLECTDYTVFHLSDHCGSFSNLGYLRNRYGSFPITAFIHSLSYQSTMASYVAITMGGLGKSDALICSSTPGSHVVGRLLSKTASIMRKEESSIQRIVVPLGVNDIGLVKSGASETTVLNMKKKLRSKFPIPANAVVGLYFGRFSDYDKMDLFPLLQALEKVVEQEPNAFLILAGNVQCEDYMQILELWSRALNLQKHVLFVKSPNEGAKKALYNLSDFFVSISDNPQETFGLSLVEAMSASLPLLVSDYNGYRELVTDEVGLKIPTIWGKFPKKSILSPVLDPATLHRQLSQALALDNSALVDALKRLYSSRTLRYRLGKAARERFLQNYNTPVVIQALERVWDDLKAGFEARDDIEDPLAMDYFDAFEEYPSMFLSGDMVVKQTEFYQRWSQKGVDFPVLTNMSWVLKKENADWVISHLKDAKSVSALEELWEQDTSILHYTIQWMLKHDLVERA